MLVGTSLVLVGASLVLAGTCLVLVGASLVLGWYLVAGCGLAGILLDPLSSSEVAVTACI